MNRKTWFMMVLALFALPDAVPAQEASLQDFVKAMQALPQIVIYQAKEIVTLDPAKPTVQAVAVLGDRIIATGALDELKAAAGKQPYRVDTTFSNQVVVPGLIAQHDHPLLAGLTMTSEIIAIEDWVLPRGTSKAAKNREEYLKRLTEANRRMKDPDAVLLTWGYHQYFHGKLKKTDLDAISGTRPIIVWHRSAHEVYLNSAAEKKYGVTRQWFDKLPDSAKKQSDFANGHYWEQGGFAVLPLIAQAIASPERVRAGLEFVKSYYHANGVTLGCEPGGILSKPMQDAQNAVLGDSSSPFRFYFIPDGKSITGAFPDEKVADETEKLLSWGHGMTAFLPKQVKLFADGAIISQLMQMKDGYLDGHHGEWILPPDELEKRARLYWNAGYQIHIHVNGDLGLEVVLDIIEKLMAVQPRADHRTVIVHFANSDEGQVGRIARLGALVSANPYYTVGFADKYGEVGLGPERADAMVRAASVIRNDIPLSYHSDLPMAPSAPLYLAWCGVNRVTPSGRVAGPEQRISVEQALRAITIEAAYSWRQEDWIGSIAPGKIANFTVLEEDPTAVDPLKLKDIAIWGTVFEGRLFPISTSAQDG